MQNFNDLCKKVDRILQLIEGGAPTPATQGATTIWGAPSQQFSYPPPRMGEARQAILGSRDNSWDLEDCRSSLQQLVNQGRDSMAMMNHLKQSMEVANQMLQQNSGTFQNLAQENAALRETLRQLLLSLNQ
jgi:hypothetical protein